MLITERNVPDFDDLSSSFHVVKGRLVNSKGLAYHDFRKTLKPKYLVVWAELMGGYFVLIVTALVLVYLRDRDLVFQAGAAVIGSVVLGYTFSYLSLFFHAASHYNLSSNKRRNDFLADGLIGILFGYPMASYRPTHFSHHRLLGLPEDPEGGYVEPLSLRFLLESLTGLRFLKLLWRHIRPEKVASSQAQHTIRLWHWVRSCGLILHGGVLLGSLWAGAHGLAIAWIIAFIIVSPMVTATRLILEHRSERADVTRTYTKTPHGAVSRIFGDGPLAQTLGGAGFNRHLLHHWDPQVSYTRLKDLERYLLDTELKPIVEARSTTYLTSFRKLFQP